MSDRPPAPIAGRDEMLLSLMDRWRSLQRQGQPVTARELCADRPDLAEDLEQLIRMEAHLGALADPPTSDDNIPTRAPAGTPTDPMPAFPSRYQIEETLGEGGMGTVYRASDQMLGRTVALKVIRTDTLTPAARARFESEARSVAALDHPHIIKIFDVLEWPSTDGTAPALALEFVPEGSLTRKLGRSALAPQEAARLAAMLARAVAHAHERGIVHRDLKPDNVLMAAPSGVAALDTPLGCPRVSDFGLARQSTARRLTQAGALMGTPSYMAPEQAEGLPDVGAAADVYALGVILYRLLTGKVPFEAPSLVDLLYQVRHAEPTPPSKVRPVPAALEAVCLTCLSKRPEDRPTASELAARLEAFVGSVAERVPGPLPETSRRPRRAVLLAAGVAVAALAWGLWPPREGKDGRTVVPAEPLEIRPVRVTLYERDGDEGVKRGVLGKDVFGARFGDAVTVTVELSAPAYFFVIGFNFDGSEQLVWPGDDEGNPLPDMVPPKLAGRRQPQGDYRLFLEEEGADSGIQAYVVVASAVPLPAYSEWRKTREGVKWGRLAAKEKVWQGDVKGTYEATESGVDRGPAGRLTSGPPLAELCRALTSGEEVAEAVAFGVRARAKR